LLNTVTQFRSFLARHAPAAWHSVRWILLRAAALLGTFLLFLLVLTGAAGWYTSRSVFCSSCHIMEPYYKSWQESAHKEVACIECHFPPGFGQKIRGKMLGLVQLAKYVTKSEGPRPAAEIPDASCLRSGCHEKRLLSGRVTFRGVPFDHTPHLGDLRRGKKLRCTSCHSQIVQGQHITVTTSTCFLCHFKNELFNEGLGACTRCHQIPDEKFDLGGGIMFSHDLAYEKGVDCVNCHGDVIRGEGEVPRERCLSCHNREEDLKRIGDHEFMHRNHVTDHKIDCLHCHLQIQHSLDRDKLRHAAGNCTACHPDHHHEQLDMLHGVGAKEIPSLPSAMLATRADCQTCHRVKDVSPTGTVLWKGSAEICGMCHDAAEVGRIESYHGQLRASLAELQSSITRLREALPSARLAPQRSAAMAAELDDLQHDLSFLRAGNDIHNIHYARKLSQVLVDRVAALCRELQIAEPKLTLPPSLKQLK
jgi:nitrate/TMAO reductase-like tetraheme cytochrome c subunit